MTPPGSGVRFVLDKHYRISTLDRAQAGLDAVGFAGPAGPFADAANGAISAVRGHWLEAGISVVAMVPLAGDSAKAAYLAGKYGDEAVGIAGRAGRPLEIQSGELTESQLLDSAIDYLGEGYREASPGRYVSADGTRQFRYGSHETRNSENHHAHFESIENGAITENAVVKIEKDER